VQILRFQSGAAAVPIRVWSKAGVIASILRETVLHPFHTSILIPDESTGPASPDNSKASGRIDGEALRESAGG
jgi:hypothetical protein